MLKPKRLCGSSLARKKTVKWELERRFPARYTASNSPRRTSRASRGNRFPRTFKPGARSLFPALFGGEPMASLLAARRQHFAAALGLHANAEAVRLSASAASRLKRALWQNNPPLLLAIGSTQSRGGFFHPQRQNSPLAASAADSEFSSVFDPCAQGQETHGVAYRAGKSDTPSQGAASDVGSKRSLAPVEYCHSDPGVKSVA